MNKQTSREVHSSRYNGSLWKVTTLALALAVAASVRADLLWDGEREVNAAGGNTLITGDVTLTGNTELTLFFGLEYLVVAGGGGGGGIGTVSGASGGGGAGGLLKYVEGEDHNAADGLFSVTPQSYLVSVAGGGGGGTGVERGENGENSSFGTIESVGGGGGGGANLSGSAGGSGGGGGTQGTVNYSGGGGTLGQGHPGGRAAGNVSSGTRARRGGGGGGAGGDGVDGVEEGQAGAGGPGLPTSITGTEVRLAGGGGGGTGTNDLDSAGSGMDGGGSGTFDGTGASGDANTGGGGGGTGRWGGGPYTGGAGGSGIVMVRYEGTEAAAGGTLTYITEHAYGVAPGTYDPLTHGAVQYTVHAFTATGGHNFVASDLDLDERLGATLSGNVSGAHGLEFKGPGTLTLSGNNTYEGGTTVSAGMLRVDNTAGSGTGTGAVTIAAGAALGGSGSIAADVTFVQGAKFLFDPSATLTIDGTILFEGTGENAFGVADLLVADWGLVPNETYILINGMVNMGSLANVGEESAFDLADGRLAYFEQGSLALTVIPEPGSLMLMLLATALLPVLRRRRRR